ncbi:hypothetical protein [Agaribacterium haliotis]|uniref:hypothetical protein n=1 Tax=Agaribacterium haliotis TaxID=2013869 RepID=UPI000BB53795|nr:hypothetical protein [Agaribacterium haliotis]
MYNDIEEAMLGLSVWKKHLRASVNPISKNIACKPAFDADYYREAVLYRFVELTESAYSLYKSNFLVGAVTVARASQETLAVAWFINSKLEHLTKTKDLSHFSEIMKRLIVGWSNDEEFPEKINVFKCIDSVDKVMEGKFRRHYEMLCEYAHPNYSGTFGAYGKPNHERLEVTLGNYPRSKDTLKKHIESTLIICVSLLDSIQEEYESVINSALDICFDLHKEGKLKEQMQ